MSGQAATPPAGTPAPANPPAPPAPATPPPPAPPETPPGTPPATPPPDAAATPPASATPAPDAATPPPDDRSPAERRIQELVAQNKRLQTIADASQDYANFWKTRAAQGAKVPDDVAAAQAAANAPKPAPKLSEFKGNTEKWADALQAWNDAEIQRRVSLGLSDATAKATAAQTQQQRRATYQQRVDEFKKTHADFDAVIRTPGLEVSETMRDAIVASDIGPAVAHYLGNNVSVSQEIAALPKEMQLFRMGEVVATVRAAAATPAPPPPPATPPPPNPIDAQNPPSVNIYAGSLDDFLTARLGTRPPAP